MGAVHTYMDDATGVLRDDDDQAFYSAIFRVKSIANGVYEFERASTNTPVPFPAWVNIGDKVVVVAFPKFDKVLGIKCLNNLQFSGGMGRTTPFAKADVFFKFQAQPSGITWKKLADRKKAIFDITRQVRHSERFFYGANKPSNSSTWPTTDEKPNDDSHDTDEDCITPKANNHDFLFSFDSPGDRNKRIPKDFSYVFRGNFREFVRVNFVSSATTNDAQYWGQNLIKGTRCSDRIQWCAAINTIYDKNKVDNRVAAGAGSLRFKWKYRLKFDLPDGTEEGGDNLPTLSLRLEAPGVPKSVRDNAIYLRANFSDSEVAVVPTYEVVRKPKK